LIISIILLPSSLGALSTVPTSSKDSANLFSTFTPKLVLLTSLPLNLIVALTLLPSSKNFLAFLALN